MIEAYSNFDRTKALKSNSHESVLLKSLIFLKTNPNDL